MYEARDNGTINVYNGDNVRVYNGPVIKIGKMAVPHWRSLNHKMKKGKINSYFVGNVDNPEIHLIHTERTIFDTPTHIEKEPVDIVCDIYDFNKRTNAGKLSIDNGASVSVIDYPFRVVGSQDKIDYIASMARTAVKATVLREVAIDPLGESSIVRLHMLEIKP